MSKGSRGTGCVMRSVVSGLWMVGLSIGLVACASGGSTSSQGRVTAPASQVKPSAMAGVSNTVASPTLLSKLRSCGLPKLAEVRTALAATSTSEIDLHQLHVVYERPPPPPYHVAPKYAVPKSSCLYKAPGGVSEEVFAISWLTGPTVPAEFGTGPGHEAMTTPPGAVAAYRVGGADGIPQVLYPGVWVQWTPLPGERLSPLIEHAIAQCISRSC